MTMKFKYHPNDIIGIYKLIKFSHRIKDSYYWNVECQKCKKLSTKQLSRKGFEKTKYCNLCVRGKYITYKSPEEYIREKTTIDENGCWLWKGHISKKNGYCLSKYRGIQKKAHAFSYETFKGPIKKGNCICHHCDIRHCLNPDHLFSGTHSDNVQDCIKKKRDNPPIGERCAQSKLKEGQVLEIRKLKNGGMEQKEIARIFGCSRSTICTICKHKTWKHVK